MTEKLDFYRGIVQEGDKRDRERNKLWARIDDMDMCRWGLPGELKKLPWMRSFISTAPHDAISAATRALSTVMPNIEIQPLAPNQGELDRIEMVEQNLMWHFKQMNRKGVVYPLWQIVNSALKYNVVAFQTEYLPYSLKQGGRKSEKRFQYLPKMGSFVWRVHNPQNIHALTDEYGLQSVWVVDKLTVKDLKERFGKNPGLDKLVIKLATTHKNAKSAEMDATQVMFYDYTDWNDRVQWAIIGENTEGEAFELMREPHGLPFIPWVYREGTNPLLESVANSNLWENLNVILSLRYALVVGVVSQPAYASQTASGDGVDIDYKNPGGQVQLKPGEQIMPMSPRQLDPHLSELVAEGTNAIHTTTVARALQTLEFSGNTPFATVNAILNAAIASLSGPRRIAETAIEEGLYQMLHWVKHSKEPMVGYLASDVSDTMRRGKYLKLLADEYEPADFDISIELRADTATDKQARVAMGVQMNQALKIPLSKVYEDIGIDNGEVLQEQWYQEKMDEATIQAEAQKIQAEVQLQVQQAQMAMQMEAQNAMQQQQMAQQGAPGMPPGMEGQQPQIGDMMMQEAMGAMYNPAAGGMPAQTVNPGATREMVTGQAYGGEEIAGV